MVFIYILKLEDGCFYVGRTTNLQLRLKQHKNGEGSKWTEKHPPLIDKETGDLVLEDLKETDDYFDEDKYVKRTMAKYGIDNVRGGSYSRIVLPKEEIDTINKELANCQDRCFKCGKPGHFVKDCPKTNDAVIDIPQPKKHSRSYVEDFCSIQ